MSLVLSEDQELIAKIARDFIEEESPVSRMRALRDAEDPVGFSPDLWKQMAELGWLGIPFPESIGGAGMGFSELSVVLEALGRNLVPEPFLSSVLLGGQALLLAGSESQQAEWLAPMIKGDKILSLAYQEARGRYAVNAIESRAEKSGKGYTISGEKVHVFDGHSADAIIVSALTPAGVSLFLVPSDTAGLRRERQVRLDSRGAAVVSLDSVAVGADALVGEEGKAGEILERVVDRATVGLCADMLGGMAQAFDLTLDYLKEREQFGARIGSFQALKHRAAKLFIEIELSRSASMAAARAVDAEDPELAKLVSLAKARCSDAFLLAGNEGVQMFGGVGMTDEYDIGLYLKRARAAELTFGDSAWHRDRWARLSGY
ncbi:MAG: acyl-CoA dehydrogenase [Myxococcota bacterium]|nr:acyl-CoA dehydrogenase [Myxococcota bacterium]